MENPIKLSILVSPKIHFPTVSIKSTRNTCFFIPYLFCSWHSHSYSLQVCFLLPSFIHSLMLKEVKSAVLFCFFFICGCKPKVVCDFCNALCSLLLQQQTKTTITKESEVEKYNFIFDMTGSQMKDSYSKYFLFHSNTSPKKAK